MTHQQFGEALGVSKRTSARWTSGYSIPLVSQVCTLARLVYPEDAELAAELAAAASETLVTLGLEPPPTPSPPPSPPPPALVVDAVVCVAADALQATPSAVRGAVLAAFKRARELRLSVEDVESALTPPAPPAPPPARAKAPAPK